MTSTQLTDQKPRVDPVDALRLLVADLRALADRLELKERSRSLQQTLQATQERLAGPRAVVMLLGEHEELKRRFLERLLGPNLKQVPSPTTACIRLEYGAEPECTVTMPQGLTAVLPLAQLESFTSRPGIAMVGETTGETARRTIQAIRLPNPTLKGGLAVIDTPVVGSGEPQASVLECAERADAWIFVLHADHELSEASQALLRQLPEHGARLEMVVEGAEALNAEARIIARDRLMQMLRERCSIEAPRLTLIGSAATEGDEGTFWHGRFATFHSVMMLRGRERWLEATRTMVADALSEVGAEIDFELKSIGLGLRHARLRLGMKDLDGLRMRFSALGELESERPPGTKPVETKPLDTKRAEAMPHQSMLADMWSGQSERVAVDPGTELSPMMMLQEAIAAALISEGDAAQATMDAVGDAPSVCTTVLKAANAAETTKAESSTGSRQNVASRSPAAEISAPAPSRPAIPVAPSPSAKAAGPPTAPTPMGEPTFVSFRRPTAELRVKRGISVHFREDLARLMGRSKATAGGKMTLPKRVAGVALVIAFICLIVWALSPRGFFFGHEPAAEWDYHQPKPAPAASHAAPAATGNAGGDLPLPGNANSLPGPTQAATPNIPTIPLPKHRPGIRTPLLRPIPSGETAGVAGHAKRHHRHLLGLGKLWHWVRHGRSKNNQKKQNNQ
jgi:hypothetical protein